MRKTSIGLDFIVILIFVAIGRSVHDHGVKISGLASTTWPFLTGAIVGWTLLVSKGRALTSPRSGFVVVLSTVAIGMVLRVVAGQGTAVAFIVVAIVFLGAMMLGWRYAIAGVERVRSTRPKS
jgi:hypothetical protein